MDKPEDVVGNIKFYLDQTLGSLPESLPEGMVKEAGANIRPLVDIAKKFADGVLRISASGRYTDEGLSERRQELAAEADASLRDFEENAVRKVAEQIEETEKEMTMPVDAAALIEERVDPWSYKALLRHAKEAEIRAYLRTLDEIKRMAVYSSACADNDSFTIGAIESAPACMRLFPEDEIKKRQATRRARQHPEAAKRLEQLETLRTFYTRSFGYARGKMGVSAAREPQIFSPK